MFSGIIFAIIVLGCSALVVFLIWDRQKLVRRFEKIEGQVGNVVPYWRAVQTKLIADLTHPHEAAERVDELLRRLEADPEMEMTDEDRQELLEGLARRAAGEDPKIGEDERRKAQIFPLVMEEVQKEAANKNPITSVQLIGVKESKSNE